MQGRKALGARGRIHPMSVLGGGGWVGGHAAALVVTAIHKNALEVPLEERCGQATHPEKRGVQEVLLCHLSPRRPSGYSRHNRAHALV